MNKINKIKVGLCGILAAGYLAIAAPAIPYMIGDIIAKRGTEQMSNIPRKTAAWEILKTMYGGMVWFPYQRSKDFFSDKEEYTFIVNKEKQEQYIFNKGGELVLQTLTSTGMQKKDKRVFLQDQFTPEGKYLAVKSFDKDGLLSWFGEEKAQMYGEGMLLFLGHWFPHIGIHGTTHEELLGQEASRGCPRVNKKTIEWILEHAAAGSKMVVQPYGVVPHTFQDGDLLKERISKEFNPHLGEKQTPSLGEVVFIEDYKPVENNESVEKEKSKRDIEEKKQEKKDKKSDSS
ncbi:L,D-transpeptidase [Candidatus Woesearchaeota archaeon]|nr:L,D-transpeptidase [Candidatus Woesearchaeota archaeon]